MVKDFIDTNDFSAKELLDMIHGFEHFLPIDPALVPPASLLREFIGGGIYDYT